MPEGRPYILGNTSADFASINATSEISASQPPPRGRAIENPRAVSYENDGSYVQPRRPPPMCRSTARRDRKCCGRGLY